MLHIFVILTLSEAEREDLLSLLFFAANSRALQQHGEPSGSPLVFPLL
jgi:hypothetical protein